MGTPRDSQLSPLNRTIRAAVAALFASFVTVWLLEEHPNRPLIIWTVEEGMAARIGAIVLVLCGAIAGSACALIAFQRRCTVAELAVGIVVAAALVLLGMVVVGYVVGLAQVTGAGNKTLARGLVVGLPMGTILGFATGLIAMSGWPSLRRQRQVFQSRKMPMPDAQFLEALHIDPADADIALANQIASPCSEADRRLT